MNKQKIGIYCTIEKTNIKPQKGTIYNVYTLPAFDNNKTTEYTDGENIKSNKFKVFPHSILFNKLNVRFKRVWNIDEYVEENGICSTEYLPIKVISDELDKDYLFYILISDDFTNSINASRKGTSNSHQRIDIENVFEYEIIVPNIEEQKKIASIFRTIDKKIEVNKAINRNLQDQAQMIFKEWFIDNLENTSWSTGAFSDLIVSTLGGDWGKEEETGNFTEQVYCIRGADIPEVNAGNKGKMPTRYILPKNYASKQLIAGDIVVEISGGSPTQSTGRVASVSQSLLDRYDRGMVCTNFCRALKPKQGYSMFIYYYWQYLYDKGIFFLYENGTTGIKNLDINGFLENEKIVLPPFKLVDEFDDFCQAIFNQIFKNGISTEKLAETRDVLLSRLMSGELDVSEFDL